MEPLKFHHTTEYSWGEKLWSACSLLVAVEFLYFSFRHTMENLFKEWTLPKEVRLWQVQVGFFAIIFICNVLTHFAGKYENKVRIGLSLGGLFFLGQYIFRHMEEITSGLAGKAAPYLDAWNRYYDTNYAVPGGTLHQEDYALGCVIVALWFIVLLLYYMTSLRTFLLLPSLLVVVAGLLVNYLPDWAGLRDMCIGIVLVRLGTIRPGRITFVPDYRGSSKARHSFFRPLVTVVSAGVLGMMFIHFTGYALAPLTAKFLEKAPDFLAFQKQLEQDVKNLDIQGISAFTAREYVDNSTPQYTGKEILTISSKEKPDSNMYLCEFVSGTYEKGHWSDDSKEFKHAARQSRQDASAIAKELVQQAYVTADRTIECWDWEYQIDYKRKGDNRALTPYLTDVAGNDAIRIEKEGLIKKKRLKSSLSFTGRNMNTDLKVGLLSDEDKGNGWYNHYVGGHYCKKSTLSSIHELTEEVDFLPYLTAIQISPDIYSKRWRTAMDVRNYLHERASYNLYLDDLPPGRDVIDFFLEVSREGYCMHFATAGVLALQELGIPARYASGYVVKKDAFVSKAAGGYEATVVDRNAHAWVEIYMGPLGWIPFEMTPGYNDQGEGLPTDESNQQELKRKHESKSEEPKESQTEETEESEATEATEESEAGEDLQTQALPVGLGGNEPGGTNTALGDAGFFSRLWAVCRVISIILVAVLMFIALVAFLWNRYQGQLMKELRKGQYRYAVRRINYRIFQRLRRSGHALTRLTDAEYEKRLIQFYPAISPDKWKEFMRIARKAAYSKETISREEMAFCYTIYQRHRKR